MDFGRTTVHKHCLLSLLEKRRGVAENKKAEILVAEIFQKDLKEQKSMNSKVHWMKFSL